MSEELDQIILRLEVIKDIVEDDDIADDLNEIINNLYAWENKNSPEETDDD